MTKERVVELMRDIMAEPETPKGACPMCRKTPAVFHRHDKRPRQWWINNFGTVIKLLGWICRYICPLCKGRFVYHPDYSLANKRYVRDDVEEMSSTYLELEEATLFSTLQNHGVPEHEEPLLQAEESFTARSTVWRWTEWLGEQKELLHKLRRWILAADPSSPVARRTELVSAHKYRSVERHDRLSIAGQVLPLHILFRRVADQLFSPHCATQGSGP
jgi:hypothetical protein